MASEKVRASPNLRIADMEWHIRPNGLRVVNKITKFTTTTTTTGIHLHILLEIKVDTPHFLLKLAMYIQSSSHYRDLMEKSRN